MTEENARLTANVILGVAGVAVAYVVLTTPPLRRLAIGAVRSWIAAGGIRSLLT